MSNSTLSAATQLRSILLATDLSEVSDKPLRHALAIARHYGAKLYPTHVVSSLGYTIAGAQAIQLAFEAARRDMNKLEHDLVESGSLAGLQHQFIVRQGDVWEQLQCVIRENQVDLIVVGTHGRNNLGKFILGSVAEQIFRRADRPVLTVGPGSAEDSPIERAGPLRPFLFASDFGPASLRALPHAISFANHFGTKLVLLHVAPVAPIPEGFHWSSTTSDVRKMQEDAHRDALKRFKKMISANVVLTTSPEFVVKFGTPSQMILHVARELRTDLVVMGLNRSRHIDTASHMLGTIAYEVVCRSGCSVLTVRS
jgi:nucleotide-binding universal stress UspA family protein